VFVLKLIHALSYDILSLSLSLSLWYLLQPNHQLNGKDIFQSDSPSFDP
jgi:hypothetical protein